jgi:hypothetical protein
MVTAVLISNTRGRRGSLVFGAKESYVYFLNSNIFKLPYMLVHLTLHIYHLGWVSKRYSPSDAAP